MYVCISNYKLTNGIGLRPVWALGFSKFKSPKPNQYESWDQFFGNQDEIPHPIV